MKQKLRHLRYVDSNGNISNLGGITVSALVDDNFNVIQYGVAKCHAYDNFSKRFGRIKATGRMRSKSGIIPVHRDMKFGDLIDMISDESDFLIHGRQ